MGAVILFAEGDLPGTFGGQCACHGPLTIPTVRLEEGGNGAGAINGAREMEAIMKKWQNGDAYM